jgi:hypothetical protein
MEYVANSSSPENTQIDLLRAAISAQVLDNYPEQVGQVLIGQIYSRDRKSIDYLADLFALPDSDMDALPQHATPLSTRVKRARLTLLSELSQYTDGLPGSDESIATDHVKTEYISKLYHAAGQSRPYWMNVLPSDTPINDYQKVFLAVETRIRVDNFVPDRYGLRYYDIVLSNVGVIDKIIAEYTAQNLEPPLSTRYAKLLCDGIDRPTALERLGLKPDDKKTLDHAVASIIRYVDEDKIIRVKADHDRGILFRNGRRTTSEERSVNPRQRGGNRIPGIGEQRSVSPDLKPKPRAAPVPVSDEMLAAFYAHREASRLAGDRAMSLPDFRKYFEESK